MLLNNADVDIRSRVHWIINGLRQHSEDARSEGKLTFKRCSKPKGRPIRAANDWNKI